MKYEHIDSICTQLGVALAELSRYNSENEDEIKHIQDIFFIKGNNKEKVLALLYMFSSGAEDETVQKYREQTGMYGEEYVSARLLEQYKVPLLTALIYNRAFYAMTVNYCGFVSAGLSIVPEEKDYTSATLANTSKLTVSRQRWQHFPVRPRRVIAAVAAAGVILIFFFAVLFRPFIIGYGKQINNAWVSSLIEPAKTPDGIAYVSMADMGTRIDLLSPLAGRPKGVQDETGNTRSVINYYTGAIRKDKENADLYINRGIAYTIGGYLDAALKDYNKAIKIDSQNASAYYNRAIANAGKGIEIDVIIADLKTVISINPDDKGTYFAIGVLYYEQYKKDKTASSLESAINALEQIQGYNKDTDDFLRFLNELNQ